MKILISMNSGDNFKFEITEENYKSFKVDTSIYNWLKLNDYGYKANTEVFIIKENIYKTTCKDCEYNDNCENVTKKERLK